MTINMSETTEKVFLWTSTVYHLLDRRQPMLPGDTEARRPAICGTKPYWPGGWWTPEMDQAKADSLELCGRCNLQKEMRPSVYGD